jgi:hypothetical protein
MKDMFGDDFRLNKQANDCHGNSHHLISMKYMLSCLRFSVYILKLTCFAKSCPCDQNLIDSSAKLWQSSDRDAMDQVRIASTSHILEHSPDDEIEGEIVYLQFNLLKDSIAVKQRYGKGRHFLLSAFPFVMRRYQAVLVAILFYNCLLLQYYYVDQLSLCK